MIVREVPLAGAFAIQLEKREDYRGFFARAWCTMEAERFGLNTVWVQANIARSNPRGTVRGMHYQISPYEEVKLIRCVRGEIFDVMIDMRAQSSTFKQWWAIRLKDDDYQMVYVPQGFAHGYQALTDQAEVFYQVSQYYTPEAERGVRWNDPAFGVEWPMKESVIVSEKDQNWPLFRETIAPQPGPREHSPDAEAIG